MTRSPDDLIPYQRCTPPWLAAPPDEAACPLNPDDELLGDGRAGDLSAVAGRAPRAGDFAAGAAVAGGALLVITPLLGTKPVFVPENRHTRWTADDWSPPEESKLLCTTGPGEPGGYTGPQARPTVAIQGFPGAGGLAGGRTGTQFTGA